jgi:hypothetical protein
LKSLVPIPTFKSYGSGCYFLKVTVPVPVPAPYLGHKKANCSTKILEFFCLILIKLF